MLIAKRKKKHSKINNLEGKGMPNHYVKNELPAQCNKKNTLGKHHIKGKKKDVT